MPDVIVDKVIENAKIEEDALLYRITSPSYADHHQLLNGRGCIRGDGRFHRFHQFTSYASNNVLLSITEALYHMGWNALIKLKNNSYSEFRKTAKKTAVLVVFRCNAFSKLVSLESSEARQKYQLNPSLITHPGKVYRPLRDAGDKIRNANHDGIVYPSARHHKGLAVCLFLDQSKLIKNIEAKLEITLSLVSEDLCTLAHDPSFDVVNKRISYSIGHYEIDQNDFDNHKDLLYPELPDSSRYIEFRRIDYGTASYPACALIK